MAKTYTEQLDNVQAAIEAIESGSQSYTIQTVGGSRTVTFADLNTLYAREKRLLVQVKRESNGGMGVSYVSKNS